MKVPKNLRRLEDVQSKLVKSGWIYIGSIKVDEEWNAYVLKTCPATKRDDVAKGRTVWADFYNDCVHIKTAYLLLSPTVHSVWTRESQTLLPVTKWKIFDEKTELNV